MSTELFSPREVVVILGGNDLEMASAKEMALKAGVEVIDRNLSWGVKVSDIIDVVREQRQQGKVVVLLEFDDDCDDIDDNVFILDHHGMSAGSESMLEELNVFLRENLIDADIPPLNRQQRLIAANDVGYIPAMLKLGATWEEVKSVRKMEYACKGITEFEINQCRSAAHLAEYHPEWDLYVVKCANNRTGPIIDELFILNHLLGRGEKGKESNVFIHPVKTKDITGFECNFYGAGDVVYLLQAMFHNKSHIGGRLPERGYCCLTKINWYELPDISYAITNSLSKLCVIKNAMNRNQDS